MSNIKNEKNTKFKSGFVTLLGRPNVGKSTLMNALVGQKLSSITAKAQTTRHKILGIIHGKDYQIIYSDTPGIISPKYELHNNMMKEAFSAIPGSDIILWIVDIFDSAINLNTEKNKEIDSDNKKELSYKRFLEKSMKEKIPIVLVINKVDLISDSDQLKNIIEFYSKKYPTFHIMPISALKKINLKSLFDIILENIPLHPPFYPEDIISDKPEKFFISEIIREKIFISYKKEIPYSTEVQIKEFIDKANVVFIKAVILVERESQKYIILSNKGLILKKIGVKSRIEMEKIFNKKVYLELFVKVDPNWRQNEKALKRLGY